MDWFTGKSTGNHGFSHEIWGFPVFFPQTNPLNRNMTICWGLTCTGRSRAHGLWPNLWLVPRIGCQEKPANVWWLLPSGKLSHNYGKSPFLMGRLTIIRVFSIAMLNYLRVVVYHPSRWWRILRHIQKWCFILRRFQVHMVHMCMLQGRKRVWSQAPFVLGSSLWLVSQIQFVVELRPKRSKKRRSPWGARVSQAHS
jgi:hypothetical protein